MNQPNSTWSVAIARSARAEVGECCPRQPYVELRIPDNSKSVRRVVVTTLSHDQGWSDQPHLAGKYEGSCTFFEILVKTSSEHERTGGVSRRSFQRNFHALRQPRRHENVWDSASGDDAQQRFVEGIKAGDTISIIPVAIFQGWVNFIYEIEIRAEGEIENHMGSTALGVPSTSITAAKVNIYEPLDVSRQQTRLLTIHPGAFEEPLICSLTTMSLDGSGHENYEALSYCWGDSRSQAIIQLQRGDEDGGEIFDMPVGESLHDALKHLRPHSGQPRKIWADAICIDQSSVEERSQQVALMRTIYVQADSVLVWLGMSTEWTRKAFTMFKALQNRLRDQLASSPEFTAEQMETLESDAVSSEVPERVGFLSLWSQCQFDWFRRTWVLQEIWNAKAASVHCGFDTVSWSTVSVLLRQFSLEKFVKSFVQSGRVPHFTTGDAIVPSIFLRALWPFENDQRPHNSDEIGQEEILDILIKSHGLKVSDPRDKIFALLQFGVETHNIAGLPDQIRPDYSKSTEKVFTDFVRWWICEHKSLRILSTVHTLKHRGWQQMYYGHPMDLETLGYPTWCFWHAGNEHSIGSTLGLSLHSPYQASGDTVPDTDLISSDEAALHPEVLRLSGHRICTISEISPFPFLDREASGRLGELEDAFMQIFDPAGHRWSLSQDERLLKGSMFNRTVQQFLSRHLMSHLQGFDDEANHFQCLSQCLFTADVSGTTRNGLCPHNARPGDIVCMLHGGSVLYLLREKANPQENTSGDGGKQGKRFEFVGECLLQGHMNGQVVEEVEKNATAKEIFDLV
ncbi:heterokaryon incompatibility protein-domain-containing protein [Dactylonectria estremocensis]|uniref:Heterokaryon incompatibility protein-domain-containing protein n=1 Tax=Dactylonectria estremocensis TaxID=1079267 RepID=A0A9P9EUT3_9HYPO|nr:heterokaryon incompatibility protein-domain-containing protein [Dactylonectria estremocensis]